MSKKSLVGVAGLFLLTALTACGGSDTTTETSVVEITETTSASSTYPVTVGDLTLATQPMRIVSLSPTATEMLYAIGAGKQVVAVDDYSNFPAEAVALGTALSGFEPNVEAIAGFKPDLVVISNDPGGLMDQLKTLSVPVFMAPAAATFDDAYAQIEQLGLLTGHLDTAVQVSSQMKADISAAVAEVKIPTTPLTYFHELDNTLYSATSNTFIGQVYSLFGLKNIADGVETGNDYPQLSAEVIVKANPDIIFISDSDSVETVAARDGWGKLKAVTSNQVILLPADIPSRWGPRLVEFVIAIRDAVLMTLANA
ncbi:MAG: ABC transporter substrate-binding protein [Actinobacteria bacterium]|nr:ABC transporter substrate-binding protein [Actinomycetota bacterium]